MALSSPGIGSGLDINTLVGQLMALERRPLTALDRKEADFQAKLSAYGTLKGALSSLQTAVSALADPAKFTALKAGVADATILAATAGGSAVAGSYAVEVQTLAQSQKIQSGTFASTSTVIGSGTLTIQFGTYSGGGVSPSSGTFTLNPDKATKTITIGTSQNTLAGIRDAINAANAGVGASIVNDGTGYRLVLTSKDSGVANALKISVDNASLNPLIYDASAGGTTNLTQTVAAQNATLKIDGISISKASNTITDAIQGVTLNLLKTSATGVTTALTVARDSAGVQSAVQSFVKAFNDASKTLADLSAYNASTKQGAVLQGDSTVRTIQSQLRAVLNTALTTAGAGLTTLSDIGVSFQKDGTLTLDSVKLQKVIDDPTKDISTLFAAVGKPTDSLISFAGSTTSTKPGIFAVNVTQLATRGQAVGSVAAGTTITAGTNDTLAVTVDGIAATVTLSAGTYTATTLAAEIQSKLNGASALSSAGIGVSVSQSAGVLTVISNRYGSASTVQSIAGNAAAGLFGTPTSTAGVDVAGTIGGATATGSGQTLTASGGNPSGLKITVTGGATGSRGTISFAQGYAYALNDLVGKFLGSDGQVTSRTDGINRSVKEIGSQREALALRLEQIERRLRAQFTALDLMVASMTKTSNFLQQQLANLPKIQS